MKYQTVYFDAENQKIRFTQSAPENLAVTYNYVGKSTRVEFDLLIELLRYKFEDGEIEKTIEWEEKAIEQMPKDKFIKNLEKFKSALK